MKAYFLLLLLAQVINTTVSEFDIFEYTIHFTIPDSSKWHLYRDIKPDSIDPAGWLTFLHDPVYDKNGYPVKPGISIFYEKVADSIDVIWYSFIQKNSAKVRYEVKR